MFTFCRKVIFASSHIFVALSFQATEGYVMRRAEHNTGLHWELDKLNEDRQGNKEGEKKGNRSRR